MRSGLAVRHVTRGALAAVGALSAVAAILIASPAAAAPSDGLVVNEVYGGGGNSGSSFTNDFVELANRGTTAVDLSGYSVQYHSGSATGAWQVTPLSGSIAPGGLYLVQESQGAGGTVALPTPDASGTIALSATSGTVALVASASALSLCRPGRMQCGRSGPRRLRHGGARGCAGRSRRIQHHVRAAARRCRHRPQCRRLHLGRSDAACREPPVDPDGPEPADPRPPAHPRPSGLELDLPDQRPDGHERSRHRDRCPADGQQPRILAAGPERRRRPRYERGRLRLHLGADRRRRGLRRRQWHGEGLLPAVVRPDRRDDLQPVGDRDREFDRVRHLARQRPSGAGRADAVDRSRPVRARSGRREHRIDPDHADAFRARLLRVDRRDAHRGRQRTRRRSVRQLRRAVRDDQAGATGELPGWNAPHRGERDAVRAARGRRRQRLEPRRERR